MKFIFSLRALLQVNPDVYTVWNWHREELILLMQQQPSEKIETVVVRELELSKAGIEKNPKSYPTWYHRRWVIEWGGPSIVEQDGLNDILRNELKLCSLLLKKDERNFHCWTYRTWVSEQLALSAKEEFSFTTEKINENFSNYSAFHRRSQLLTSLAEEGEADGKVDARCELLSNELHMARTAYFTEPDDQSAWWYVRFLVSWANGSSEGEGVQSLEKGESKKLLTPTLWAVLEEEVQAIKELLEFEPRSKWPRISLVDILGKLGRTEEAVILCDELIEVDPGHSMHYHYLMRKWQQHM
eukprot:453583_1